MIHPLLRNAVLALACTGAAGASLARDPVILIPGLTAQPTAMNTMRDNFVRAGWDPAQVITWTDSTNMTGDLAQAGVELGRKVDSVLAQTGASKVVLITWSASTLAGRSYLKKVAGAQDKVSMYFSMAGPHHGTTTASGCPQYTACKQFAQGSGFLADLNAGSEVPGAPAVRYITFRSSCDMNVNPTDSAMLAGADNRMTPTCITHFDFPNNGPLFNVIRDAIADGGQPPTGAPAAPAGLAAGVPTANSVPLGWGAVPGVAGYNVYRAASASGPWSRANATPLSATSYTATGLQGGTTYHFTVRAVDAAGTESANSNVVSATTTGSSACFNASNYAHTVAGRAYQSGGRAYAMGSANPLGIWATWVFSKLRQTGPGYYVVDPGCP